MARLKASAFTFIHNAIESGYPIVEAIRQVAAHVEEVVVCDMQSTDNTREVIEGISDFLPTANVRIIDGEWLPGQAGECLKRAHARHVECEYEQIIHFEGDEVFDDRLMWSIQKTIRNGVCSFNVYRTQIEQNFQRARWYSVAVHRVFLKGTVVKEGHTTDIGHIFPVLRPEDGYLWDCASTCRDNFLPRMEKQAELWGHPQPIYRVTPIHFAQSFLIPADEIGAYLALPHWTWTVSPFRLPHVLERLVGKTKYEPLQKEVR